MSVESVVKFYHEVIKDKNLVNKLKDLNKDNLTEKAFNERILPEAKAKGYDFTYEDVKEFYENQVEKSELNMSEMEAVSGGGCTPPKVKSPSSQQSRSCNFYTPYSQKPQEDSTCNDCSHLVQAQNYYVCDFGL